MWIKYTKPRRAVSKGPIIYLAQEGGSYRLELNKPTEVPDHIGHDILSKMGDCIDKVEKPRPKRKKAAKKAAPAAPKNKMLEEAPEDK